MSEQTDTQIVDMVGKGMIGSVAGRIAVCSLVLRFFEEYQDGNHIPRILEYLYDLAPISEGTVITPQRFAGSTLFARFCAQKGIDLVVDGELQKRLMDDEVGRGVSLRIEIAATCHFFALYLLELTEQEKGIQLLRELEQARDRKEAIHIIVKTRAENILGRIFGSENVEVIEVIDLDDSEA